MATVRRVNACRHPDIPVHIYDNTNLIPES